MHVQRHQCFAPLIIAATAVLWAVTPAWSIAQTPRPCPDATLFSSALTPTAGRAQRHARVADFNGDGIPDLALTSGGLVILLGERPAGPGAVRYALPDFYGSSPGAQGLTVADLNGDRILDVAVANEGAGISLYRGLGSNGRGDGRFEFYGYIPSEANSWDVTAGDVNADGAMDLVVGGYLNTLTIFLGETIGGRPTGQFPNRRAILTNGHLKGLQLADFNGDGALDVVAATEISHIVVHRGLFGATGPSGDFGPPVTFNGTGSTYDVAVADFNEDGKLDVATANYLDRSVSVFLGDGNLGFPLVVRHPVAGFPLGIAAADFNHDHHVDLVAAATGEAGFSFLPNHGALAEYYRDGLRPFIPFGAARTGYDVEAADLNGDGSVDVVLPALDDTLLAVFPNSCLGDVPTATLASLVSIESCSNRIELTWYMDEPGAVATIERRGSDTGWRAIGASISDGRGFLRYEDRDVSAGSRYGYRLGIRNGASESFAGETWTETPVAAFTLTVESPNPTFGGRCVVRYSLASGDPAHVELIDPGGRRCIRFGLEAKPGPGAVELGRDEPIPAGIYWLRLEQLGIVRATRLVVLN